MSDNVPATDTGVNDVNEGSSVNTLYLVGDRVRISGSYTWGDGRYAGREATITAVQDDRAEHPDALIYGAYLEPGEGVELPLLPADISGYGCSCRPGDGLLNHWGCQLHDSYHAADED